MRPEQEREKSRVIYCPDLCQRSYACVPAVKRNQEKQKGRSTRTALKAPNGIECGHETEEMGREVK
jgi:hypothetical protein